MSFLPVRARYLAPRPLESHLQIWEIFPKFEGSRNRHQGREKHAYLRRPLQPRPTAPRPRAALHPPRGAYPHHPCMDRPHRRPHPQALSHLSLRGGRRWRRAPPRQVAAPGGVFHAQPADAARSGGVRQRQQPVRPDHAATPSPWSTRHSRHPRWRAAPCSARPSRPIGRWSASRRSPSSTRCYLLGALHAGDELRVAHCRDCAGVLVTDRLALRTPVCNECGGVRGPAAVAEAGT